MKKIFYIDRESGEKKEEKVYGKLAISLIYGQGFFSKCFSILLFFAKLPILSKFYGYLQKTKRSAKKIAPFIKNFAVEEKEFEKTTFESFNDFFIRKLKKDARPISLANAVMPADARYLFFQNISKLDHFFVKGKKFCLPLLLQSKKLAKEYENGAMAFARLCPSDYHRFHFPIDCIPSKPKLINGTLSSVNPTALKKDLSILWENKRVVTTLESKEFSKVLFIEIGATFVGSIHQTYKAGHACKKGEEKGYFSFGGSSLIILFKEGKITFDKDLLDTNGFEVRALLGQSMGASVNHRNLNL